MIGYQVGDMAASHASRPSAGGPALALALVLVLAGSESFPLAKDQESGWLTVSSVPTNLFLRVTIESDAGYPGTGRDALNDIRMDLDIQALSLSDGECVALAATVRDAGGEVMVRAASGASACDSVWIAIPSDACAQHLPGRCDLSLAAEISADREVEVKWDLEAEVHAAEGCGGEPTDADVVVGQVEG
jgi:hypothetical protein